MAASTGMFRFAHSMRRTPSAARARSLTSCRLVVAIRLLSLAFGPPVSVLEPDDIFELRRRDLEDGRVLDRGHPVNGARTDPKGGPGAHDLGLRHGRPRGGELELGSPGLDQPGLVLVAVELEAERFARLHEDDLPAVLVAERPDELVPPGLVDLPRLDGERLEAAEVGRGQMVVHAFAAVLSHSGFARRCSSAR